MLDRVADLVPGISEGIWGGTFHSIGNRILRHHAEALGFRPKFSILDREDQEALIEAVVTKSGHRANDKNFPKASVLADIFSFSVNTCLPVGKVITQKHRYFYRFTEEIERMQQDYEARKLAANAFDFDDLLSKTLGLLELNPEILEKYQTMFRHVLVDEYQDTNLLQARLVELLSAKYGSLMVVGDDAQSIYSWRGADCANILEFPKRYLDAKVFKIETNYRSVPEVLTLANAAIAGNLNQFPKNLSAVRAPSSVRPALVALATNNQQAIFVAKRMKELAEEGIPYSEMAVLYRAHYHSMEVQMEFTRRGLPFNLTSGLRFFEQAHIKDVAAYMKLAVNPTDETAFKRIVRLMPGIGAKSAENLFEQARKILDGTSQFARLASCAKVPAKAVTGWKQMVHTMEELAPEGVPLAPAEMIQIILLAGYEDYLKIEYSNFESRKEDLETVENYAKEFTDTEEFLSQLALLSAVDAPQGAPSESENEKEKITLSSIHQAKGLEWKVVFVLWLTDGMFPSSRSLEDPLALDEERRLFYVAVTRCRDDLYLTYPEMRLNGGYGDSLQRPSRFLGELPAETVETWEILPQYSSPYQKASWSEEEPF